MAKFPQENPNPVLRVSQDGVVLFGNRASQKLLDHWTCSIGTPLPDIWREKVTERFRLGVAGEAMLECNGRIFLLQLVPIVENHYLNIYGRDITERRQAEQALAQAMQELQGHINNSPLAIVSFDPEYRITEWSAGAERMFGWRADEVLNKTITDLRWVHEEDAQHVASLSADMFAGRTSSNAHANRNYRKDGSVIECEWYNSALRDMHGKLISVLSQVLDVTERKRAEQHLEQSNQKLNEILASIQDDFYVLDHDWNFAYANRLFTSRVGKEPEDFIGHNIWKMFPKHRGTIVEENFRAAMEKREIRRFEARGKYTSAWYRLTVFPSAEGITVLGADITKRKLAEDALRKSKKQLQLLNETLEQKVQEKTAEVHQLASDLVRVVQRERHRLSHILHDDLQQRIYAIRIQLTFLHDELQRENEGARREVSDIEKQLAEALEVTRNLSIDLSPPILRDEGLSHAIKWLAARMGQRYGLPIELQADGVFALAEEELHVLLFNCVRGLLFNVVKHAHASRAVVALQWSDADLRIEVRDDGIGFPVDGPLQPVNRDMSEDNEVQSSSGLSAIRHQLRLFGGRMEIQAAPGAGTQIILIIPVTEGDQKNVATG
ncbi:MAG: PAS domain S-box protein [Chloroflexi bacterium]|nr:MAG: PAS domain S-box protein [Chloroflexota bacterium]